MPNYIEEIQGIAQGAILNAYAIADRHNVEKSAAISNLVKLIQATAFVSVYETTEEDTGDE